jgi:glyoxalase family protein
MQLEGLHHITMITADAQRNVDFYADVLGLRLVKTTVNFDDPEAYHLYFGDERGAPGSILTFFEYAGAERGQAGAGMIHTILLGVASQEALAFWEDRLGAAGRPVERAEGSLRFEDPDGLALELVVAEGRDEPLAAEHPEVPAGAAIVGIAGARAYSAFANVEERLLSDILGFTHLGDGRYRLEGGGRGFDWAFEQATRSGRPGAGTVHHIAWASRDEDHERWRERVARAGGFVTDVIDRDYFRAIYFRTLRGVLFEIATPSPGFAVDEDPERLGEQLRLPPMHEHLRDRLERTLTPIVNPRAARRARAAAPEAATGGRG